MADRKECSDCIHVEYTDNPRDPRNPRIIKTCFSKGDPRRKLQCERCIRPSKFEHNPPRESKPESDYKTARYFGYVVPYGSLLGSD